jgi:methionyl-tRNA formyltransferase
LIRGANPSPGAHARLEGEQVRIFDCARRPEAGGAPGTVLGVEADGFTLALSEGSLLVKRVQAAGGGKVSAAAFAAERGLTAGTRFEDGLISPI